MQILSIHLKNIKSHRDTELTFAPGINVLSGPNGVGKSTIFEAIGYALFGVDAQCFVGNVERFISIGAKRGEIVLIFQPTDGSRYRVSRTVGTPSKWLLAKEVGGDFEVEEHKDGKETEARLKELLGLTSGRSLAEQFELVIGPFQHDFLGPFVIKQPSRRRDKFDEILGIDTWRKTFNETKVLTSVIKAKIDALASAIAPLTEQVAELPGKKEAHQGALQTLKETGAALQDSQQQLGNCEALLVEADQHEQNLKTLEAEIGRLKERIENGKERISQQRLLIDEAEQARRIIEETAPGKIAFEQAEIQLLNLREQAKLQRQLEQEMTALKNQADRLDERFQVESEAVNRVREELLHEEDELGKKRAALTLDKRQQDQAERLPEIRTALDQLRKQLGQLEGRRAALEEGREKLGEGICPFFQEPCRNIAEQPAGDVFTDKLAGLDEERRRLTVAIEQLVRQEKAAALAKDQLKEVAVTLTGLDLHREKLVERRRMNEEKADSLKDLHQQQQKVQQQLTEKQQALIGYNQLQREIETAEQEKARYQPVRDRYVAHQQRAAELEQRRVDLQKFEQLLARLQQDIERKDADFNSAGKNYDAVQHELLRRRKDGLRQQVGALGEKVNGVTAEVTRLAGEIDKLKQIEREIAARRDQIKACKEKDELVKFLRNRVFRNVSGFLSERFREEISRRANRIYRIIAEVDEELAWGDNYQILLRDMTEGELRERTDEQLSGGQTMSAVVALRLAMLQTIGARIAFFDEPTSNLDVTRRENLAHAFRAIDVGKEEVTEHWYDQLFLISHDVAFTEITDQILPLT